MDSPPDAQADQQQALDPRAVALSRAQKEWHELGVKLRTVTPRAIARFLLIVAALAVVTWLFVTGASQLFWFFVGGVIAYLLLPLINYAEDWMPRWAAIILVYICAILLFVGAVILIVPPLLNQIGGLLDSLPSAKQVHEWLVHVDTYIKALPPHLQTFINDSITKGADAIKTSLSDLVKNIADFILSVVSSLSDLIGFLLGFIVVPFWVFYVLRDQKKGKHAIDFLLPVWLRLDFWAAVRIVDGIFGSWIRAQVFLSTVLGVEIFVGLNLLILLGVPGIHSVLLLAIIAFVTSPIPYVANYLAAIPAVFIGMQTGPETVLCIVAVYIISQNVQDNLLSPRINGNALNIHPAILMPTIIVLARFGLLWVILAGPIAATSRDLVLYAYGRLQDPPQPAGVLPRAYGDNPLTVLTPDGREVVVSVETDSRAAEPVTPSAV